jgi:hypothetical protein
MNRPTDPIELQAMEAWYKFKKSHPDYNQIEPISLFIQGYIAAIRTNNETKNP